MKKENGLVEISIEQMHPIFYNALQYFDSFCQKNGINYFVMWGTLLGLVRGGEIILWDDDMDVGMSRKDFSIFLKLRKEFNNADYSACYFDDGSKIEVNEIRIKINGLYFHNKFESGKYDRRVAIDVFVYDSVPDTKENIDRTFSSLFRINKLLSIKYYLRGSRNRFNSFAHFLVSKLLVFPTGKYLHKKYEIISQRFDTSNTKKVFFPATIIDGRLFPYDRSIFENLERRQFGPIQVMCPKNPIPLLLAAYGKTWNIPIDRSLGVSLRLKFFANKDLLVKSQVFYQEDKQ
jgi:lipopolysaccharide cholinephosphotransferase